MKYACKMSESFKFLLNQNFLRVCTKLKCTSVAWRYVKFTNLIVLGTKFVPLEMKLCEYWKQFFDDYNSLPIPDYTVTSFVLDLSKLS